MARESIGSEAWRRAWQRESRLLARVRRAAWRRKMAELERTWVIASAQAEGVSIRKIVAAAGLGPTRVHAIVRDAELDGLDAALGELRSLYGWPAPEDPEGSRDEELAGRELIAERLVDEVQWLCDCAGWLEQLERGEYPPVVNLRPEADHPDRCNIVVDLDRVRRVLLRIAADIDELARARTVADLEHAQIDPDVRAERRRRLAEPPLAFPAHGRSIRQYRQALYEFEKERWRRGETVLEIAGIGVALLMGIVNLWNSRRIAVRQEQGKRLAYSVEDDVVRSGGLHYTSDSARERIEREALEL